MTEYRFLAPPKAPGEIGRLGGYSVKRVLGEGGMGLVFAAEDLALHRPVALKVLRPDLTDDSFRKRFFQEARISASLPHDHIVTVYQVGEDNGIPFLAMELLQGQELEDRLKQDNWLPLEEALSITRQVAEGLAVAHEKGLIHRDIKPANIWLQAGPGEGRFKRVIILDFGLARPINNYANLTAQGQILATPSYMAPEIAYGGPLDARTDLFSLGCVLYRCLTGHTPFAEDERKGTLLLMKAVVEKEPKPAEELAPQLPKSVTRLIRHLMAKKPEDRPPSARAVIERVRALERGEPGPVSSAELPPLPHTLLPAEEARRKRFALTWTMFLGAGIILVALLIGLAVGLNRYFSRPSDPGRPPPTGPGAGGPQGPNPALQDGPVNPD